MKKKITFFVFTIISIFLIYSKNVRFETQSKQIIFPQEIKVGYFFEKYPFFYFNKNKEVFEGYDIKLLNNILTYIKQNRNKKSDKVTFKFFKINLNNIPENLDFIVGGIIYSDFLNNITNKFIKINYYSESILLLKNKNTKSILFNELLNRKILIGVKLYSMSYYFFEDLINIVKFAFYEDLLNNLNRGGIKYALIDKHDLKFVNLKKYYNISIQETIYKENYVILMNIKYSKYGIDIENFVNKSQKIQHQFLIGGKDD